MSRTRRLAAVVVVIVALALVAWWAIARHDAPAADSPAATSGVPSTTPARTTSSASASTPSCSPSGTPFVPTSFQIARLKIQAPVMAVDEKSSNGTMAPPKDDPWTVAWLKDFPKPGSRTGAVDITAHTYHAGGALGNVLYDTNPLHAGDIIRLSDAQGHVQCYRYEKEVKFSAADYAASSTVFYDPAAPAQLRLMICWDYDAASGEWDSRVVFQATPVA